MSVGHESWSDDDPWEAFGEGDRLSGESGGGRGGPAAWPADHMQSPGRSRGSAPDTVSAGPGQPFGGAACFDGETDPFRDATDPLRDDRRPGTGQSTGGGPPVWLLTVAGVASAVGLVAALWPGVVVGRLLAAWFVCGFVVLGLLVTFTWLDVRRRAQFHYPGRPDLSLVRAIVLLVSVGGVAVAAVRVSVLVGHYGWSALWS
jgi:hypothetical protein